MEETANLHEGGHGGFHLDKKHLMILGVMGVAVIGFFVSKKTASPALTSNDTSSYAAPVYTGWAYGTAPTLPGNDTTGPSSTAPSQPGTTILTPAPPVAPTSGTVPQAPTTPPPASPIGVQTPGAPIPVPAYVNPTNDPAVARQTIAQVNTYMAAAAAQNAVTQPMQDNLHAQKVQAAAVIGERVDDWGIARSNATGAIDFGTSAGLTPSSINAYATAKAGTLSSSDLAALHQQKVAQEAALGNRVTADGSVFDSKGRPVGPNGRG